jgi:spore coat protein U-like protein
MMRTGLLLLLALALLPGAARAQTAVSCTASIANLPFGSVNVLTGARFDTASALTVQCAGGPTGAGHVVRACVSVGPGHATSYPPRALFNGAAALRFEIYPSSSGNTPLGSWSGAYGSAQGLTIDIPLVGGAGSAQRSIYASILPGQRSAPTGSYFETFSDSATNLVYALDVGQAPCVALAGKRANFSFSASAQVSPSCVISASDLNFGVITDLSRAHDAQTSISVSCSAGLAHTIGLDGGRAGAADPTLRQMTSGENALHYGLYHDAGRSRPWGASATNSHSGVGSGVAQTIPIYGRIHAGQKPTPGTYTDVIVVTVSY